jgi:GNAT superfamily N-acetyltransferase
MLVPGYTIRLSRKSELAAVPEIERRAKERFASATAALGSSSDPALQVDSGAALLRAHEDGRLWIAERIAAQRTAAGEGVAADDGVAADESDQIVGFALVREIGLFAHLEEIDVLPAHGRQGLGSALLEAVCEWAYSRGFSAVTLSTFRDVAWNAPFFTRRGFALIPPAELPPELIEIVQREAKQGLRTDLRVVMQRDV